MKNLTSVAVGIAAGAILSTSAMLSGADASTTAPADTSTTVVQHRCADHSIQQRTVTTFTNDDGTVAAATTFSRWRTTSWTCGLNVATWISFRPCTQEDSLNCSWNASEQGNGVGHSFIVRRIPHTGQVCYLFAKKADRSLDFCTRSH